MTIKLYHLSIDKYGFDLYVNQKQSLNLEEICKLTSNKDKPYTRKQLVKLNKMTISTGLTTVHVKYNYVFKGASWQ